MHWSLAVGAAMFTIIAHPVWAGEPRRPTGKWVVDFGAAQCIATRNYGPDEKPLYLVLKAPPLGDVLQIGVVRTGQLGEARQIDGELVFDQHPPIRTNLLEYGVRTLKQRALLVNLPLQNLAPMRTASSLSIRARHGEVLLLGSRINQAGSGTEERFALTHMVPLLKTMDRCVADLRAMWNVTDPTGSQSKLKERAKGNIASFFSNDDYPAIALNRDQSGTVAFVLLIDEAGKVADCTVTATSGAASLDSQSCAVLRLRAKFTPAMGADGKSAKDVLIGRVRWQIAGQ